MTHHDKPLHVLHVIACIDAQGGGPVTALQGITLGQINAGLNVSVISTFRQNDNLSIADQLRDKKVQVQLVGPTRGPLATHPDLKPQLHKLIAEADIVHIHALWEEIQHQAATIARSLKKPYIIRPCGMLDPWSLNQSKLKKKIYLAWRLKKNLNRANALHFTANMERDLTAPLKLRAPAIVEPNGVSLGEFETLPDKGSFRNKYPKLKEKTVALFLSRVHHKKGLDILIPAFAKADVPDSMLVIAGPVAEGYQATVDQMIAQNNLQDRIILTGMLRGRDRIEAYVDADLFTLSSYQENFGIVVIESLASATPVLISDQINIHDQITAAGVGQVLPLDIQQWADALKNWLSDVDKRQSAGEKCQPFVWQNYDWNVIAENWIGHYKKMIEQNS